MGTAEWKIARLKRYQNEIHRKYSISVLCLIFFFIGAPLGAIIRKGGLGMPVIASVGLFLIYYVISMMGRNFPERELSLLCWNVDVHHSFLPRSASGSPKKQPKTQ